MLTILDYKICFEKYLKSGLAHSKFIIKTFQHGDLQNITLFVKVLTAKLVILYIICITIQYIDRQEYVFFHLTLLTSLHNNRFYSLASLSSSTVMINTLQ